MKYSFYIILFLIITFFILISCSDDPSSIGINLLQEDYVVSSTYDTKDNPIEQSSSNFKKVIPLGLSSKILIGKTDNSEAYALLQFGFRVADSLVEDFLNDNIVVNRAFIELAPKYTFTDESAQLNFSFYKIDGSLPSKDFTIDSLTNLSYEDIDLSLVKDINDSLYTIDIDLDFVTSRIISSIDTTLEKYFGIFIQPDIASGKIVGFQALTSTSSDAAKLKVIIEKPNSFIDTISAILFADLSVVTGDLPTLPQGDIGIQSSISIQSKLLFDLESLPQNIAINKTEIILTEDTLSSVTGSSFNSTLSLYRITDSTDVTIDENNGIILTKSNGIYTGDITGMMNHWFRYDDNQGVVIRPTSLIEGLELFAIKGSNNSEQAARPRLKIIYTGKEN